MNIALATVTNNSLVEDARLIMFNTNAERSVNLQAKPVSTILATSRHQNRKTYRVVSSISLSRLVASSPSRPCASKSANLSFSISNSPSSRSVSISRSEAAFAIRNFCVSSSTIFSACFAESCAAEASSCCAFKECRFLESFRRADSTSLIRSSRDCCRFERESFMRVTACLSGWMLKFPIVWWMSCFALA